MKANTFTFAQWAVIIHIAKYLDLGVEYTARRYGLPAREKGGGIWDDKPEEERIPPLDMELE